MFEPDITINKIYFKNFSKEGIKLGIHISIKNNFIFNLTLNSLVGDLYIVNRKIKIGSDEKIGEYFCSDYVELKSKKVNIVKLSLIIYWKAIFFVIIPNLFFNSEYKAIVYIYTNIKNVNVNIYFNFKFTIPFNLKYKIHVDVSTKVCCVTLNGDIIEREDNINIFKEFFKLIRNKLRF